MCIEYTHEHLLILLSNKIVRNFSGFNSRIASVSKRIIMYTKPALPLSRDAVASVNESPRVGFALQR
jgi:hypothetical protein